MREARLIKQMKALTEFLKVLEARVKALEDENLRRKAGYPGYD